MKKLREIRVHTSTFICVTFLFGLLMFVTAWKFSFASYAMDLEEDSSPVSETVTVLKKVDAAEPDVTTSDLDVSEEEIDKTEKGNIPASKKADTDASEEKKETEAVSKVQKTESAETTVSVETSSVQTESSSKAETVQTAEPEVVQTPEPAPEPVDPYAGYSYGLGYNGRMKGYTCISSYDSYASDPSAWTSAVQATVDSGTICRCGNYFAGHNPGVMSFISGISTGETITLKNSGRAQTYQVIAINDVGSYDMPDRTFNAICGYSGEICIQFCYGGGLRLVYAVPN